MNLEIGGGPHPARPDYRQFDALDWSGRTGLQYDLGDARKLPYACGQISQIFCSNLLEHFAADENMTILDEWTRVLCQQGTLELIVPDSIGILEDFFEGRNNWEHCSVRLLGGRDYAGNEHKQAFCYWSFPKVIREIPSLELLWCKRSHAGGGIHSLSRKR